MFSAILDDGETNFLPVILGLDHSPNLLNGDQLAFDRVIVLGKKIDRTWMTLSMFKTFNGETEEAKSLCERGLKLHPENTALQTCLAWAMFNQGRDAAAGKIARGVLQVRFDDEYSRLLLGLVSIHLDDLQTLNEQANLVLSDAVPKDQVGMVGIWANHAMSFGYDSLSETLGRRALEYAIAKQDAGGAIQKLVVAHLHNALNSRDRARLARAIALHEKAVSTPSLTAKIRGALVFKLEWAKGMYGARYGLPTDAEAASKRLEAMEIEKNPKMKRSAAMLVEEIAIANSNLAVFAKVNPDGKLESIQHGYKMTMTPVRGQERQVRAYRKSGHAEAALALVRSSQEHLSGCLEGVLKSGQHRCRNHHAILLVHGAELALEVNHLEEAKAFAVQLHQIWPKADAEMALMKRLLAVEQRL